MNFKTAKALLRYEGGKLYWKERSLKWFANRNKNNCAVWNSRFAGRRAGNYSRQSGYRNVMICSVSYREHRIIWLLVTGDMPNRQIDHINGKRTDNRIENLRVVSNSQNQQNTKMRIDNRTGCVGVGRSGRYWRSRITVSGRDIYLGTFKTFFDAVEERRMAERHYGFHENHGRAA